MEKALLPRAEFYDSRSMKRLFWNVSVISFHDEENMVTLVMAGFQICHYIQ